MLLSGWKKTIKPNNQFSFTFEILLFFSNPF